MRRLKRILILLVGLLVALIVVVVVAGLLLPAEHRASRTLVTRQSPQSIWDTINNHADESKWRPDIQSVTPLGDRDGKPVWQETYKDGNTLALMTTESKPPT